MTKDLVEAVKWYRKSAEQNFARAQNSLGYSYEEGQGVAKDLVEAAKWYRKAAEQNDAMAQLNLGRCYAGAGGVPKDLVEAYKWLLLASEQGNDKARELIPLLEHQMSADKIEEAQKRALQFSAKPTTTRERPRPTDPRAERIRALANESNAALLSGNYARVADFLHPKVIEMMGGREKAIEATRQSIQDLKDHGVSILSVDFSAPERIVAANNKLFAVVPELVHMEGLKKKGHVRGFLVAVSEDAGKNWTFIDGSALTDREALERIFPDFPAELSLPKKAAPIFAPK